MSDEVMDFTHTECAEKPPFQYRASGLDNVFLRSGYTQQMVGGEVYTAVQDADELHAAIAEHLVLRRKVLRGQEVRFLRKFLGWTQADTGDALGLSDQSIARYEKEKDNATLEGPADRLFRLYVIGKIDGVIDPAKVLEEIRQSDSASSDELVFERPADHWKAAA
jgi:transcriptional regulator with XRE-family HTH domain